MGKNKRNLIKNDRVDVGIREPKKPRTKECRFICEKKNKKHTELRLCTSAASRTSGCEHMRASNQYRPPLQPHRRLARRSLVADSARATPTLQSAAGSSSAGSGASAALCRRSCGSATRRASAASARRLSAPPLDGVESHTHAT